MFIWCCDKKCFYAKNDSPPQLFFGRTRRQKLPRFSQLRCRDSIAWNGNLLYSLSVSSLLAWRTSCFPGTHCWNIEKFASTMFRKVDKQQKWWCTAKQHYTLLIFVAYKHRLVCVLLRALGNRSCLRSLAWSKRNTLHAGTWLQQYAFDPPSILCSFGFPTMSPTVKCFCRLYTSARFKGAGLIAAGHLKGSFSDPLRGSAKTVGLTVAQEGLNFVFSCLMYKNLTTVKLWQRILVEPHLATFLSSSEQEWFALPLGMRMALS